MAKRRRKTVAGALIVVLLLLGWQGLSWLDGNPDAEGDGEGDRKTKVMAGEGSPPSTARPSPKAVANGTPGEGSLASGNAATLVGSDPLATGAKPAGEGIADPLDVGAGGEPGVSSGDAPAVAGGGYSVDREESLFRLVGLAREQGALGEAYVALDKLRALPPSDRARLQGAVVAVDEALATRVEALHAALQSGAVLSARDQLVALTSPAHQAVVAEVDRLGMGQEWPRLVGNAAAADGAPLDGAVGSALPSPDPLAPQRAVLWHQPGDGAPQAARVVVCEGEAVTLKVTRGRSVTYPSVPRLQVQPVDPTAGERVEQALAALVGGDDRLARLWFASALSAGAGGDRVDVLWAALGR